MHGYTSILRILLYIVVNNNLSNATLLYLIYIYTICTMFHISLNSHACMWLSHACSKRHSLSLLEREWWLINNTNLIIITKTTTCSLHMGTTVNYIILRSSAHVQLSCMLLLHPMYTLQLALIDTGMHAQSPWLTFSNLIALYSAGGVSINSNVAI